MSDEPKPQLTTVQMQAVPTWAIDLKLAVDDLRTEVRGSRADIALVSNDLGVVKDRVVVLERRADEQDRRATSNSQRVRENSQQDLGQDAAIAAIKTEVDALREENRAQTAILTKLGDKADKLLENPRVKAVAWALLMALLTWLGSKGIKVTP